MRYLKLVGIGLMSGTIFGFRLTLKEQMTNKHYILIGWLDIPLLV